MFDSGHLTMFGDRVVVTSRGKSHWLPVGRGQGYCFAVCKSSDAHKWLPVSNVNAAIRSYRKQRAGQPRP